MQLIPFDDFVIRREQEKHWLNLNGYENADPETNGEYRVLDNLIRDCGVFVDIGANVGIFLKRIQAIKENMPCLVFEPNPFLHDALKSNVEENSEVFQVALSNRTGEGMFYRHLDDSTASSLFSRTEMMPAFTNKMEKIPVRIETLANYADKIRDKSDGKGIFVKIDAEGSELHVLEGAEKVLGLNQSMFILFEYASGWKESGTLLKGAFHALDRHQFSLFRLTPYGLEHVRFFHPSMENYMYCNYLAIKNFDLEDVFSQKSRIPTPVTHTDFYLFPSNQA